MEYLQYIKKDQQQHLYFKVLNLIINGIPSIRRNRILNQRNYKRFKPYYKWNTFNTNDLKLMSDLFGSGF